MTEEQSEKVLALLEQILAEMKGLSGKLDEIKTNGREVKNAIDSMSLTLDEMSSNIT